MDINEGDRHHWFNRGKILANLGKLEAAIACYERAIKLKPDYYEAWCEKGLILEQLGLIEAADACFNQALGVFTSSVEASLEDDILAVIPAIDEASSYYNKACFHALQANIEQAIANLQEAIKLHPDKYRSMAVQDSDFAAIKKDQNFFKSLEMRCNQTLAS